MPNAPQLFTVPRDSRPDTCHGCGAPIYWIVTAKSKRMPVNTRVEGGLDPLVDREGRGISHFADCPKAAHFRRAPRVGKRSEASQ